MLSIGWGLQYAYREFLNELTLSQRKTLEADAFIRCLLHDFRGCGVGTCCMGVGDDGPVVRSPAAQYLSALAGGLPQRQKLPSLEQLVRGWSGTGEWGQKGFVRSTQQWPSCSCLPWELGQDRALVSSSLQKGVGNMEPRGLSASEGL